MTTTPLTRRQSLACERAAPAGAPADVPAAMEGHIAGTRRASGERSRGRRAAERPSPAGLPFALARALVGVRPRSSGSRAVARPDRQRSIGPTRASSWDSSATARARIDHRRAASAGAAPRSSSTRTAVACAMLFVGATIVSTSVPANAYFVDTPAESAVKLALANGARLTTSSGDAGQVVITAEDVRVGVAGRDGFSVSSSASPALATAAASPTGDRTAAIRWPFSTSVPISSGFGSRRVAHCTFCSTNHRGLDFIPAAGTPIEAVAAGTVSRVEQGGGGLGYNVWIDHLIEGVSVTTVYAHMTAGSIRVAIGQTVAPGTVVGLVGSTGNSTGPHLHFEVHVADVAVDPYAWLVAHSGAAD